MFAIALGMQRCGGADPKAVIAEVAGGIDCKRRPVVDAMQVIAVHCDAYAVFKLTRHIGFDNYQINHSSEPVLISCFFHLSDWP